MRLRFLSSTAAAIAVSAVCVAAAQTPQPQRQPSPNQPTAAPNAGSAVTVSGCLQRGNADGSIAGTALGTSVPPADAGPTANVNAAVGFMLTDATPVAAATRANAGQAGPVGTSGAAANAPNATSPSDRTSYVVEGDAAQFEAHLGKRVSVTGTIAPPAESGAGVRGADGVQAHAGVPQGGAGRTAAAGQGEAAFRSGIQRVRVTSIQPATGDCKPNR